MPRPASPGSAAARNVLHGFPVNLDSYRQEQAVPLSAPGVTAASLQRLLVLAWIRRGRSRRNVPTGRSGRHGGRGGWRPARPSSRPPPTLALALTARREDQNVDPGPGGEPRDVLDDRSAAGQFLPAVDVAGAEDNLGYLLGSGEFDQGGGGIVGMQVVPGKP